MYIWWMYIYEYDVRLLFIRTRVSDVLTYIEDTHVRLHIIFLKSYTWFISSIIVY